MDNPVDHARLTAKQLQIAKIANPYFYQRLQYDLQIVHPLALPDDAAFAEAVAYWQQLQLLRIDGILGPKTYQLWQHQKLYQPPAQQLLWVNGQAIAVDFAVVSFAHPLGLSFYGTHTYAPRQLPPTQKIDLLVLHWDECLSAHDCFAVLLWRGLSAHLLLDADGVVYQTLDLQQACAFHAKTNNQRAIGIEINNPLHLTPESASWPICTEPTAHSGELLTHTDFTAAQKQQLPAVVATLCQLLAIPLQLPLTPTGEVSPTLVAANYQGICGHYHVSREKIDPGFCLWPLLLPLTR